MKTIYKHTLIRKDSNIITLPKSSKVLSVETQGDSIVIYYLLEKEEVETKKVEFLTFGTGFGIDFNIDEYQFLGTVKLLGGNLMFHVFYKELPNE